jgi:hypothetical protein
LPLFFFFPCVFCSVVFFFLFLLSSSVSLLGATGGCREEEQRWRCRAEGGRRWFFFFPPSTPPLVFFLSVMFCFSSPSLVLLALAALVVAEWRCWMVVAEWLCSQWMAMPDGGSALSLLCVFFVFLLLPVSVSCSSVSSSSFFLLEDGLRWSCCGATGRNGGGGYADHSRWFFLSSPLFGFSLLCFQMFSVFSPFKTIPPPLTMSFASLIHQNFAPPLLSCNLPLYL